MAVSEYSAGNSLQPSAFSLQPSAFSLQPSVVSESFAHFAVKIFNRKGR
jgi:hypothetical protein